MKKALSGRLRYTMPRSAHYTLKRNITYLFTYESIEYLPKTNNGLESEFAHLKTKLRVHSGLKLENKIKVGDSRPTFLQLCQNS